MSNIYQFYNTGKLEEEIGYLKWTILDSSFDTSAQILFETESDEFTKREQELFVFLAQNQHDLLLGANITDIAILYEKILTILEEGNSWNEIEDESYLNELINRLQDPKTISYRFDEIYEMYSH